MKNITGVRSSWYQISIFLVYPSSLLKIHGEEECEVGGLGVAVRGQVTQAWTPILKRMFFVCH